MTIPRFTAADLLARFRAEFDPVILFSSTGIVLTLVATYFIVDIFSIR